MKKGFTLVELLATITILAVILAIAVPQVIKVIDGSRDKAYENQKKLILDTVDIYIEENNINPYTIDNVTHITLLDLQNEGLLPSPLKNPKGGNFSEDTLITISINEEGNLVIDLNLP